MGKINIFGDFLLNNGLYDSTDINEDNIEQLIIDASRIAVNDNKIIEGKLESIRAVERIDKFKYYLTLMLYENSSIYGILSKGIYEMSEEQCLEYFPILKECILEY